MYFPAVPLLELALLTILLGLAFTFTNGFQEASSIAATFIASRSATPRTGVILVAVISFFGAICRRECGRLHADRPCQPPFPGQEVIVLFVSLVTAIAWNIITWKFGIPASTTHSRIGGLVRGAPSGNRSSHQRELIQEESVRILRVRRYAHNGN